MPGARTAPIEYTRSSKAKTLDLNDSREKFEDKFGEAAQTEPKRQNAEREWRRQVMRDGRMEAALCCPEDAERSDQRRHDEAFVCSKCRIPVCSDCCGLARDSGKIPGVLAIDNSSDTCANSL